MFVFYTDRKLSVINSKFSDICYKCYNVTLLLLYPKYIGSSPSGKVRRGFYSRWAKALTASCTIFSASRAEQ